jgi:hypothetical protein
MDFHSRFSVVEGDSDWASQFMEGDPGSYSHKTYWARCSRIGQTNHRSISEFSSLGQSVVVRLQEVLRTLDMSTRLISLSLGGILQIPRRDIVQLYLPNLRRLETSDHIIATNGQFPKLAPQRKHPTDGIARH